MTGSTELHRFLNALRILHSIDLYEMQDAGSVRSGDTGGWVEFRDDPVDWMVHASDIAAAAVWRVVQSRQPDKLTQSSNADQFLNKLRIICSIDRDELVNAAAIHPCSTADWSKFSENPARWMMRAHRIAAEAVWSIIESREAPLNLAWTVAGNQNAMSV